MTRVIDIVRSAIATLLTAAIPAEGFRGRAYPPIHARRFDDRLLWSIAPYERRWLGLSPGWWYVRPMAAGSASVYFFPAARSADTSDEGVGGRFYPYSGVLSSGDSAGLTPGLMVYLPRGYDVRVRSAEEEASVYLAAWRYDPLDWLKIPRPIGRIVQGGAE